MSQDYYQLLGIAQDASDQEIKRAFRAIARECHPDVAGDDPALHERFKAARRAYEILMDPVTRARYERRNERKASRGGSFFDAFYNHVSGGFGDQPTASPASPGPSPRPSYGAHDAGGHASSRGARGGRNDLDLDDLFSDFGKGRGARRGGPATPQRPTPTMGDDVHIEVDVPAFVAREGGTVTAVYFRKQRTDSWRSGSPDPGVARVQDIADIRVLPGTTDGDSLRELGGGDAGPFGGPYGALMVRVRVLPEVEAPPPAAARYAEPDASAPAAADEPELADETFDLTVVEALLGGQVSVETPRGRVRMNIPAGTSGGTRLRLRGRAHDGGDLCLRARIVVPRDLDDESIALIRRFAELNPMK